MKTIQIEDENESTISNSPIEETQESGNQNLNSPIDEIHYEPVDTYTFEQLKEVWYLGMLNGATLWQVCQDNTDNKVSSFEKVIYELRNAVTGEQSIKDISNNNMMLLGVACEVLGITDLK